MSTIARLERLWSLMLLSLITKEAVHAAGEMMMQSSKELSLWKAGMRGRDESLVLAHVAVGVFVIEYVIPVACQHIVSL